MLNVVGSNNCHFLFCLHRCLLFASLFSFAVAVRITSRSSCLLSYPLLFVYMTRSCLGRYQFCSFCQNYTSFAGSNLTQFLSFLFLSSLLFIIPELKGIFGRYIWISGGQKPWISCNFSLRF